MSTASKCVLGLSVILTVGVVAGVHIKQNLDRQRLHEGVLQDLERVEKKRENLRALEEQILLTKELVAQRHRQETAATASSTSSS